MADWLVEEGIGEHRALAMLGGTALRARVDWPGKASAGQVEEAKLVSRAKGSARGTAQLANGEEVLVSHLPRDAVQGASLRIEITRSQIGESGRVKRAQARPTELPLCPAPTLADSIRAAGDTVQIVRQFPDDFWEEIYDDAWTGFYDFKGGSLHFSPTPAMTLIDIDGALAPRELALAACRPIAKALGRFDIGGSIGIDFPTLEAKSDRKAVDDALAAALGDWPHEKTAMNGFGFVQIVARLERPSLLHRTHFSRTGAAARLLLRRAEEVTDPGAILLRCHHAVADKLTAPWLQSLAQRTGREIRIERDPTLAMEGGFAQAVPLESP
ncbi:Rne/Rng family ribonuclease [Pontixanthobacter aquaemixtae]|uniref:Ribonuclease n=1 Tax=Pontixanthobacter aquaemixtae TaxID=1958940 RepID=A0A844ZRG4_9SPHN|nr:ribonuclease [Pontixanthobacter aquaemixtae]MXO89680.1 ribonuclease [Pontixanthobacter aquaemixtae]